MEDLVNICRAPTLNLHYLLWSCTNFELKAIFSMLCIISSEHKTTPSSKSLNVYIQLTQGLN